MNNQQNANPNSTVRPTATSVSIGDPVGLNPTATPTASVVTTPQATSTVSASARPAASATRGTGSERKRSMTPRCESSATPAAAFMPENSTPVTTKPGTRKST